MATKAEWFRYADERTGPKRSKHVGHQARPASGSARSESAHADKKAAYTLEDSAGRPSRKCSRKASHRMRTDAKSQALHWLAEVRPRAPIAGHR